MINKVIKFIYKIFVKEKLYDASCIIGENTYIGQGGMITKTTIGNYCTIGNNVFIGQGEHDYKQISLRGLFYDYDNYKELTKKECSIGHDVWIGVSSIVLRGVKVGNGAVIGANSVVTKDIPDFAIAVGSPAKVIKYRFNHRVIEKINESKWFEYDFDTAHYIVKRLEEEISRKERNND